MNSPKPIHIVMVHKSYPPRMGGIERHIRDISEALVQRGWQVTALVCADDRNAADETINGVRVIRIPRWGAFLSQPLTWNYTKTLLSLNPDIVHCHVPFPLAWLAVRKLPQHVPVICTWHSDIVRQRILMPLLNGWEQSFLTRCNRIIVTSPEYLQSSVPLQNHHTKCEIIPLTLPNHTGLSDELIQASAKKYLQQFTKKRVLYVGRLVGYKGLQYLIYAMKDVDADLIIAGDGPLESQLRMLTNEFQLTTKIHFLGFVDEAEKQALYRIADVLVLPSIQRSEAFGYVLLEAMSNGCPVISTDLPTGVRWVNRHEQTGLVVPTQDSRSLANAINKIINHSSIRNQYAENAKKRIENEFQFDPCLSKLETIYKASFT